MARLAYHAGGAAALLLALLALSVGTSPGNAGAPQDDAKPSKGKDDPLKKDAPQAPPVKRGLHTNDPKALQGYTLMAPIMSTKTFLLDMQGRVVRTWQSESSSALSAYLLESGHVLRFAKLAQQAFGDGPGAAGHIQEFNWEGDLVWDFKFADANRLAHHDICKMPNGNVLVIAWEKKPEAEAVAAGRRPETVKTNLLSEGIFEIKPTGKTTGEIVWEWHVWDHLIQDQDKDKANYGDVGAHPELIDVNFGESAIASMIVKPEERAKLIAAGYFSPGTSSKPQPARTDWLHANAVAYNPELDQVLVSSPEFCEFWIIDHGTTSAEAKTHKGGRSGIGGDLLYRYGNPRAYRAGKLKDQKLFYQHNAHWIPKGHPGAGHVLVFNNGKKRPGGAHSSVDELALPADKDGHYDHKPGTAFGPDQPIWSYAAPKKSDFYAEFISGTHRLPNRNTFICAGPSGTIFEVTPEKETVWKYLNPARNEMGPPSGGAPPLVEILPGFLRDTLKSSDEQTKQLDDLRKEVEDKLQAVLTDEQKKQLKGPPPGPGGPGGPAPKSVVILPAPMRPRLKLTDDQKKQLETLQKEAEANLDKTLTAEQQKQLKEVLSGFVNAWGGGPGGGGGPPPLGNAVYRSYRYAANYPGLAGKDLTPGKTIEELQSKEPEKK